MTQPWRWSQEDPLTLEVQDVDGIKRFRLLPTERKKVTDFAIALDRKQEVQGILERANVAFLKGLADYRDAVDNLHELLNEKSKASFEARAHAAECFGMFHPQGLGVHFTDDENVLKLALDCIKRLTTDYAPPSAPPPPPPPEAGTSAPVPPAPNEPATPVMLPEPVPTGT